MALAQGSSLGSYEILGSLGAGGMGEVYRARDADLGREVAIKVLAEDVVGDPDRLGRFEREAKLLASLNHPNIATLYGFDEADGVHFLVMELVDGETLAERLVRGPLTIREALPLFLQMADGLQAAHARGVIHRDLKPANVKIADEAQLSGNTESGRLKILDFGLGKALAGEKASAGELSDSPTLSAAVTRRGEIMGTAAYMSPEQARGKAVDRRTDIWPFGCCLFEALSGRRAFAGEDAAQTLAKVIETTPDWSALPSGLPPAIARLLRRALEKDPRRRLHDIADARLEIEEAQAAPEGEAATVVVASTPPPLWRRLLPVWTLIGGALLTAGLFWALREPLPEPRQVTTSLSLPPSDTLFFTTGVNVALSADGSHCRLERPARWAEAPLLAAFERSRVEGDPRLAGWERSVPLTGRPLARLRGTRTAAEGIPAGRDASDGR